MEEELAFEDLDAPRDIDDTAVGLGQTASSRSQSSLEGTGFPMQGPTRSSRNAGSPVGSLGSGSVASRSSDAGRSHQSSKKSMKSFDRGVDRVPGQHESINRMASI